MSYTELKAKEVVCRKPHSCVWCGEECGKQETVWFRTYVFDGDLVCDWTHLECKFAMLTFPDAEWLENEGFSAGFFQRGSHEPK